MLDEFGAEIEHADSRLDATMKKMAKALHLSDGKCDRHCSVTVFKTTSSGRVHKSSIIESNSKRCINNYISSEV